MKFGKLVAGLLVVLSANASANLIVNGSFEDNNVNSGSWANFNASTVNGWDGQNIEIWNNLFSIAAYDGNQLAELNSGGATNGPNNSYMISQTFATDVNALYNVDFAYMARNNSDESFLFEVLDGNGGSLFSQVIDDHVTGNWSTFNTMFQASTAFSTISFTTISSGSMGNLLDAVEVTSVPEPATLAPFAAALMLFGARRMKKSK